MNESPEQPQLSLTEAVHILQDHEKRDDGISTYGDYSRALEVMYRQGSADDIARHVLASPNRVAVYTALRDMQPRPDARKIAQVTAIILKDPRGKKIVAGGFAGSLVEREKSEEVERKIDAIVLTTNATVHDAAEAVRKVLSAYVPEEPKEAQPEAVKPIDMKKAVERVRETGGWNHCFPAALREARNMNGEQWTQFLAAMKVGGLKELAGALEWEYTKNGTITVRTTESTMRDIKSRSEMRHALNTAEDATRMMNESQRQSVIQALNKSGLTNLASALVAHHKRSTT